NRSTFDAVTRGILTRTGIDMGTVLTTLIDPCRIGPRLRSALEKETDERVLLGTAIAAHEYLHDDPLCNVYWTTYTQQYRPRDIETIKREFL
ncbi:hypothetical protein EDB83DRAFT_2175608, partial [Lactarius deliciosus]